MHEDLFAQAKQLATVDPKKPKQANLRRAVSAAYYAVFHFLVEEACSLILGTQHRQAGYRAVLGRGFAHATMKEACTSWGGGNLKAAVVKGLPLDANGKYKIPKAIRRIAATFAELQDKRHLADYDFTERFGRSDVLTLLEEAQSDVRQSAQ